MLQSRLIDVSFESLCTAIVREVVNDSEKKSDWKNLTHLIEEKMVLTKERILNALTRN